MRVGALGGGKEYSARVRLVSGRALDATLAETWEKIRASNSQLGSPFFSAAFTRIIAAVREGIEVAVIASDERIVAFFPFLRKRKDPIRGVPVADFMTDFVGIVCPPDFVCDPRELIRECGLARFDYHHLLGTQSFFAPSELSRERSAQIDLSAGYESYVAQKRVEGSGLIKRCANLARRMERELGPLHFVANSRDRLLLRQVMTLKASQYVQTGARDVLSVPWVREAVELIHGTQADDFAGTLSLLYAGDRLVAGHIGMRSKTVWHYHFPAYDINAAKYSPGLNLLLRMAAYAPSVGLTTIDLGKARADYKERVMNRTVDVTDGRIDLRPARPLPRLGWEAKSLATRIMLWSPFRGQI